MTKNLRHKNLWIIFSCMGGALLIWLVPHLWVKSKYDILKHSANEGVLSIQDGNEETLATIEKIRQTWAKDLVLSDFEEVFGLAQFPRNIDGAQDFFEHRVADYSFFDFEQNLLESQRAMCLSLGARPVAEDWFRSGEMIYWYDEEVAIVFMMDKERLVKAYYTNDGAESN